MKLTLGQAAKEVGISKPSLSAAIKNGRLSAHKNESGAYEIDPAELFRVYPPKANTNGEVNGKKLTSPNPVSRGNKTNPSPALTADNEVLDLLLEEKDKAIRRLEEEKEKIRQDLEDQKEQSKRITMLLEDKSSSKSDNWENSIKALESRISNQERAAKEEKERAQKILNQNRALKKALEAEKSKTLWQKLFG